MTHIPPIDFDTPTGDEMAPVRKPLDSPSHWTLWLAVSLGWVLLVLATMKFA